MISVDTAIRRGKWLFKYPWKIWWVLFVLYVIPFLPLSRWESFYRRFERSLEFYFESPLGIVGLGILIFLILFNTIIYFSYYKKWKQWAFKNVDDPDMFLREAVKNHFFMNSNELEPINRR